MQFHHYFAAGIIAAILSGALFGMNKPTFDNLIAQVRTQLQDAEGNYWTDEEITQYLDEGQLEYCRKARSLRGEAPITRRENQDVYTLPEDCLEILRIEDSEGIEIRRISSDLAERAYSNFRSRTGSTAASGSTDVRFGYSDLDGFGKIRFYPRPNPSIEETGVSIVAEEDTSVYIGQFGGLLGGYKVTDDLLIVLDSNTLRTYNSSWEQLADTSYSVGVSASSNVHKTLNSIGVMVCEQGAFTGDTYLIDPNNGASFLFHNGTISDYIQCQFPSERTDASVVVQRFTAANQYEIGTTVLPIYTFVSTEILGANFYTRIVQNPFGSGYYAILDTGDVYLLDSTGVQSSTLYSGSDSAVMASAGGRLFYDRNGDLYVYNGSVSVDTGIDLTAYSTTHERVYADDDVNPTLLYVLTNATTVGVYSFDDYSLLYEVTIGNSGDIVQFAGDTLKVGAGISAIVDPNVGAVVDIDDLAFDGEAGAVVDIESSDNEDVIVFESEFGVIESIVQDSVGMHLHYVRSPIDGVVEVNEPLALVHYALYKCYEKDGDQDNLNRALYHEGRWRKILERDIRRVANGFNNSVTPVKGYHF